MLYFVLRGIYTSWFTVMATVKHITFVLLNRGVPVIKTIYFVSKERELFTETAMSVSDHGKWSDLFSK